MPDFTLESDAPDADAPERSRPVRLVASGLVPTAAVPPGRDKGVERPAMYRACVCGALVLSGHTDDGTLLALDTHQACYTVLWLNETPAPRRTFDYGKQERLRVV